MGAEHHERGGGAEHHERPKKAAGGVAVIIFYRAAGGAAGGAAGERPQTVLLSPVRPVFLVVVRLFRPVGLLRSFYAILRGSDGPFY